MPKEPRDRMGFWEYLDRNPEVGFIVGLAILMFAFFAGGALIGLASNLTGK